MRVLITGSRTWVDNRLIYDELDTMRFSLRGHLTIVHGGCPKGADAIASRWARGFDDVSEVIHRADWSQFGRSAGPRRNAEMVKAGAAFCLAFIRNASPGATGCALLAEQHGIEVRRFLSWGPE